MTERDEPRRREAERYPAGAVHQRGTAGDAGPVSRKEEVDDVREDEEIRGRQPVEPAEGRRDVGPDLAPRS